MTNSVIEVAKNFRSSFQIAKESIQWFPGHMHKSFQSMQSKIKEVDCIFEVHDARIPLSGRNHNFVHKLIGPKPHILVLNKRDLIPKSYEKIIRTKLLEEQNVKNVLFTNCKKENCDGLKKIMPLAVELISKAERFNRSTETKLRSMIIGVPNVGKSSLINALRSKHIGKGRATPVGGIAGITRTVMNEIRIHVDPPLYVLDTPGILPPNISDVDTGMKLALCSCLKDSNVGEVSIADYMLYWFNKNKIFNYVDVLGLDSPCDDIVPVLLKLACENEFYIKKLNIATNTHEVVPDIFRASKKLITLFRTGGLGQWVLDPEVISDGYS